MFKRFDPRVALSRAAHSANPASSGESISEISGISRAHSQEPSKYAALMLAQKRLAQAYQPGTLGRLSCDALHELDDLDLRLEQAYFSGDDDSFERALKDWEEQRSRCLFALDREFQPESIKDRSETS